MGYPMASQLRQKLSAGSELWVFDVNEEATERFVSENEGSMRVSIAQNAREVAENSVRMNAVFKIVTLLNDKENRIV